MQPSLEALETRLKRNGFQPEVSVGAFENGKLVGFVLNGVRDWEGQSTLYNIATVVVAAFRGRGVGSQLLNVVNELYRNQNIAVYQLEVLQTHERALHLYTKQGFQVNRHLHSYRLNEGFHRTSENHRWQLYPVAYMESTHWQKVSNFWDSVPSWQSGEAAVRAVQDSFGYTLVELEGALIGYGIVDKLTGVIVQLAVDRRYRRKGVATAILQHLYSQTESSYLTMINVDSQDDSLHAFLQHLGFQWYVTQCEMVKVK